MSPSDSDLLRRYAQTRSEPAFTDLVARHLNLVYSSALRQVRRPHLAQEIAQNVFLDLARHASRLDPGQTLGAWLYTVTRRRAVDLIRRETRRLAHERAAMELATAPDQPEPDWSRVSPLLDEAMQILPAPERGALLLRYFENKSLREVGGALGISDDAAQKRVHRALDRLRAHFARRRLSLDAAGLAALLAGHAVQAAPAGLASTVTSFAVASAATSAGLATLFSTLVMPTLPQTLAVAGLALGLGYGIHEHSQAARLRADLSDLRARQEQSERAHADRLAALAAENTHLRTHDLPAADLASTTEADASAIAAIAAWLERVRTLRTHIEHHSEFTVPEMSLLSEDDWIDVCRVPISTDTDLRRASARLRAKAEMAFGQLAKAALQKYAATHGDHPPATTAELAPWFEPPANPAMLARWVMIPSDDPLVASVRLGSEMAFTQTGFVDFQYDTRLVISSTGFGSLMAAASESSTLQKTRAAYAAANAGRSPTNLEELLPYAVTPEAQTSLREQISRRDATRRAKAMDPLAAAAAAYAVAHPGKTLADELQLLLRHASTPEQKAALQLLLSAQSTSSR